MTTDGIRARAIERRAIEAVIWGMPIVNFDRMYQAMAGSAGGQANQIVYWSRLPDWKNQTLTPNPDAIYLMPFIDLSAGPVVLEIPAAKGGVINGSIMDCWQGALEDVGPAGVDKGAGGTYLILPPGSTDPVPDGYIPLPSNNIQNYALLRSILERGGDAGVENAVTYARQIRLYPLSAAADPPETVFLDAIDVEFDATIPYDLRFFESLDRMVQREPWIERDRVMIDVLKTIGIEKGTPFAPDEETSAALEQAMVEAREWLDAAYERLFSEPFAPGARWQLPARKELIEGISSGYADTNSYPVDDRGVTYSYAFFSAKHLGSGQFYLMTIVDAAGQPFEGASTYRLTVPAEAPVTQYWSATVYDRETHALIRGMDRASRSSQSPDLAINADGSVDLSFGPNPPSSNEGNWIPTRADRRFEVLFRFYGPEPALFEKSWRLPDIERVAGS